VWLTPWWRASGRAHEGWLYLAVALVGHHLQRLVPVFEQIDHALPVKTGVANSDIVRSYAERWRRKSEHGDKWTLCFITAGVKPPEKAGRP